MTAWLGLSAVAFGVSAFLTHKIAFVTHVLDADPHPGTILAESSGWYVFNVFAAPGTSGAAEVNYDFASSEEGDAVLSFRLPPGSEQLRVWNLYSPNGCHYMGGPKTPGVFPGRLLPDKRSAGNNAVVDLRGLTF